MLNWFVIDLFLVNIIIQNLCRHVIENRKIQEYETYCEDSLEDCGFIDCGSSMDDREIFTCNIKMGDD